MSFYNIFEDKKESKSVGQFYVDTISGCHTVKLEQGSLRRFELYPSKCPLSDHDYVIQGTNGMFLGYAYLKTRELDVLVEMELTQTDQTYFTALPKNKFLLAA